MAVCEPVELLRRQYVQLLDPDILTLPASHLLKLPDIQRRVYDTLFVHQDMDYLPPERYAFRVLKRIVGVLEQLIDDPEEDVRVLDFSVPPALLFSAFAFPLQSYMVLKP